MRLAAVGLLAGAITNGAVHAASAGPVVRPAWTTFDYNAQRTGVGPSDTGITAADLGALRRTVVRLPGTVDSSAVALVDVRVRGATRDVAIMTTSYGRTLAIDLANGRILWQFAPGSVRSLQGGPQITTAAPVIDPSLAYVYVTTPDGYVHKLALATGRQVWSTRVTYAPQREKLAGGLNFADGELIVVTGGYYGDVPTYQGHVVTIDPASGAITHVFNTLCSNIKRLIEPPTRCGASDSAIWGRPGSVVVPGTGDILVATGNGPFNGRTDWGDSVLELSPSLRLLGHWTPVDQAQLNADDRDLGSTEPALLPFRDGVQLAVQGGKQGVLSLLDISRLYAGRGPGGHRTGGALQTIPGPGATDIYSQPAVWRAPDGRVYVFVTTNSATAAYALTAARRLRLAWQDRQAGTSPLLAGGLLYVYNQLAGVLNVYNPATGHLYRSLPAAPGHWNSPIVIAGRIVLPVGNDNAHLSTGELFIYHLPRR
jgi:outer membrane protein assembly factor BamB